MIICQPVNIYHMLSPSVAHKYHLKGKDPLEESLYESLPPGFIYFFRKIILIQMDILKISLIILKSYATEVGISYILLEAKPLEHWPSVY